jgi:LacI family transcriptional regulator
MAKRVTIKDIAAAVGVSIGTVDRALHNRPGIKKETREQVLRQAKLMGYETNQLARSLARKHQLKIGCVFPAEYRFYPDIEAGINTAAEELLDHNVRVIVEKTGKLRDGQEAGSIAKLLDIGIHALAVCPGHRSQMNETINQLMEAGIPVVTIATDAPESRRLTCVSTDSFNNGQIAGDLMVNLLNYKGKVAVLTGFADVTDHEEKVRGFLDAIASNGGEIEVDVLETREDADRAYRLVKDCAAKGCDGIYINTATATVGGAAALRDIGKYREVKLVGTDLLRDGIPFIEQGVLRAVIFQDPFMQGYRAIKILFDVLTNGTSYGPTDFVRPSIVTKHNIRYYRCYS